MSTASREVELHAVAERFGTPTFVYDADVLRARTAALRTMSGDLLEVFFSLKANPNVSVCAVLAAAGARAEVSSAAELHTALAAGVRPADIVFLGPGKSEAELVACIEADLLAVVVESVAELALLDRLAGRRGRIVRAVLRVNPAFSVKGSGLTMGGKPRQFGIDEEQLECGPPLGPAFHHVRVTGVQAYVGTRILAADVIVENTVRILALAERLADRHGFPLELVDVGGGFGVAYFEGEDDLDIDAVGRALRPLLAEFRRRHPGVRTILESGRFLVADAGVYLTRVRYTKTSRGERFAVLDGGTHHHMAAVGIGSFVKRNFPVELVRRPGRADRPAGTGPWTLTGPLCTPNDVVARRVELPTLHEGDLVVVLRSGAYGPSASPGAFLGHGFPAEVLLHDGRCSVVRDRDDLTAIVGRQRLVPLARSVPAPVVPKSTTITDQTGPHS